MRAWWALAALLATSADAQQQSAPTCMRYDTVRELLSTSWGEVPIGRGMEQRGGVIEIYASANGTWTLLVIRPDAIACIIASGGEWTFVELPWPKPGEEM